MAAPTVHTRPAIAGLTWRIETMRTYYILAVQSPSQKDPVVYTTETHRPRNAFEAAMSPAKYTQAWIATTSANHAAFAAFTCSAKNRADALSKFLEDRNA